MAPRKTARPGRTLAVFFLVLAIIYALVAIGGSWKPELGLDLRGGTEIAMTAKNSQGGSVSKDSLNEARDIIDQRVNGSGVTSARVTTEGSDVIKVSIPGTGAIQRELADRVRQTAKLRFRLVACDSSSSTGCSSSSSSQSQLDNLLQNGGASGSASPSSSASPSAGASTGSNRAPVAFGKKPKAASSSSPSATPSSSASASPSASGSSSPSASPTPNASSTGSDDDAVVSVDDALSFMRSVPSQWQTKFSNYTCPAAGAKPVEDDPTKPLLTCDDKGQVKYLLTPAIIEGTEISDADYGIPQNAASYAVTLDFHSKGRSAFADATGAIAGTGELFAITLDGKVISAATADSRISGGAQITGGFSQSTAKSLANNLKYGSLPLDFPQDGIQTRNVGPSLAGNQLSAGLWAGAVGLLLVMVFCLLYYRGLGVVVVGSLIVAGFATYGMVLLLSKTAGVTLDLPGIAGLIVAVGITADSFIVYFERIRDEMREGKSMRVAVDAGWTRARNTCLAADAVSFLAALTLYIFASNEVKGFAFMLGLSTVIDLIIFFFFTHPTVKLLSGMKFFNRGHRLSGLDKEAIGIGRVATGGKA
ncbi:protein translocase subunit SecD [Nocardioides sp. KR10-350]|uniref:protein translocase subunit SecD n=1 Tax=Nocardioides cheoyonin TaxID=3156615 RepID=UPI0032B4F402